MNKTIAFGCAAFLLTGCATPPLPAPAVMKLAPSGTENAPKPLSLLYTTFQDHAVLQRGKPIPVWGLTAPGATVNVKLAGQSAQAKADDTGHWRLTLAPLAAGGPYTLSAQSSNGESQSLNDVMLGDVYLCSGQSNMEMPLRLATNYDGELLGATNPQIRLFHVQRHSSPVPKSVFGADASWAVTSPQSAKEFSATCYYFGRDLQPHAGVAIGLIEDAWGGSTIQAWISRDKLAALGGYEPSLEILKAYAVSPKDGEAQWLALVRAWFEAHDPAMKENWFAPYFDDSGWDELMATGGWRPWPKLASFDGIVWLRKTITLSAAEADGLATLTLGKMSDNDITFVNGSAVGAGEGYDVVRNYPLPTGTLHAGQNTIAIGVQMGGAFLDSADKMSLKLADGTTKPITGPWKWKASLPSSQTGRLPHQPWLNQFGTSVLYNGMITPLGETKLRGAVWYQGESDSWQPQEYGRLLTALMEDWRSKFGADTPFLIVQLPGYGPQGTAPRDTDWARTREVQRKAANEIPNAALAVTIDLGSPDNIHPQAKQEVGRRLSLAARKLVYGETINLSPAPIAAIKHGKTVTVSFSNSGSGLQAREWHRAIGFSLCETADKCRYADGIVNKDSVTLDMQNQPKATLVRFCWSDSPICNLYNDSGLPAVPFELPITKR